MPRTNRQPDVFDLGSQSKKDEENVFLHDKPMNNFSDKYINQFMDNSLNHSDPPTPDIPIEDNLGDEHSQIDLKVLSKCQQVMYVINAACRTGFLSLANAFIAQLRNFTYVQKDGLSIVCLAMYKPKLGSVQNLFWKNKDMYLYIKQFARVLVKREISSLVYLKNLCLKSF